MINPFSGELYDKFNLLYDKSSFENPLFGELVVSDFDQSNLREGTMASADIALV